MRVLSDREREVLRLRFEEDLTQSEIGVRVGVSQMHVSRLIRQSVARLREVAETGARPRRPLTRTGARRACVALLRGRDWTAAVGSALEPVPLGFREREERGDRMAEIQFKGITKRYPDGFEAVKAIDLDIADGEFMILVGPSGCGKSTALRMIAGLEDITDGDLVIGGERVNDLPPRDRDIAMVFQNYALYPHMTVRENMGFALKLAKADQGEIDRKVGEAAKILDLEQHLERKPANLSGGQRQRVAMGRAIVRDPKCFLMDEPLSNLDAKLRVQMRTEVARIQRRLGTTMVYVTHDQTEAMTLGDRVAVMRAGIIQQVDSPATLYDDPINLFVAGFIGSPSMNFLPGRLDGDKLELPFGTARCPSACEAALKRRRRRSARRHRRRPARALRGRGDRARPARA